MPKVNICAFDQECVQKFQHDIEHRCLPIHQKQRNKPYFRSPIFFLNNILPIFHPFNMPIIVLFCMCPHESLRIEILIPFSRSVGMFRIAHFLCAIASDSCLSIFIALCCVFAITCTSMDSHTSSSTTFSFPTFVCTIYASTDYCFVTLFSFDSSMNTGSTDVTLHPICYLVCKFFLLR